MNIYDNCKNIAELMDQHELDVRACETFEYLGKIERLKETLTKNIRSY